MAALFRISGRVNRGSGDAHPLLSSRSLRLPERRRIWNLGMISVFGRHLVTSEADVERGNLFLRLDLRLTPSDIFAGEGGLTSGNVGLAIDPNTEE